MAEITPVLPNAIDQLAKSQDHPADQLAVSGKPKKFKAAKIMVAPEENLKHARADYMKLKQLQPSPSRTQEVKGSKTTSRVDPQQATTKFSGFRRSN